MADMTFQNLWDRLALIGAIGLLVAIAVTGLDIFGRLTGIPVIRGAIDFVRICTVISGAFAVAMTVWRDANVRVEVLSAGIPDVFCRRLDRLWRLVAALLFGLVAWRCLIEAFHSFEVGEVMASLELSVGILGVIIFIGFGAGAVAGLLSLVSQDDAPVRKTEREVA